MMLPFRILRWANRPQLLENRSLARQSSHLSRGISISSWRPIHTRNLFSLNHSQWLSPSGRSNNPVRSINLPSKRFASTTVDIPQDLKIPSPTNAAPSSESISQFTSSSLEDITPESYSPIISEHVGYLKELGLNYGWGPTAIVETILESVHLATGTPWWGSIMLTTLLLRVAFLKLHINAADTMARLATLTPHMAPIKERISAAKLTQDMEALNLASAEMKRLYLAANIEVWRMFLPFLVQIPLGFATFRLLRGMATLPVPGLDEGGLLWLKDLTLSDPYFILPMAVGGAFYWTMKKGGDTGSAPMMQPAMKKLMLYVFPTITTMFMLALPGALQLSFSVTSMMSLLQSHLFRQPGVRRFLRIQPLPQPAAPSDSVYTGTITIQAPSYSIPEPPPAPKGIIEGALVDIKGAASQVMKTARSMQESDDTKKGTHRLTKAELKRAQSYEAQRKREIAEEKLEAKSRRSRNENGNQRKKRPA